MGDFDLKDIWNAVEDYYGKDPLESLFKGELTADEVKAIIDKTPNIKTVYNKDGSVAWRYLESTIDTAKKVASGTAGSVSDSTSLPATGGTKSKVNVKIPMNVTPAATAGKYAVKSGITKTALKVAARGNAIGGAVSTAYEGASTIISLGKGLEKKLYDVAPDFWNSHGLETLDPSTWGKIINRDTVGDKVLRFIYQIEKDESTGQVKGAVNYIPENSMGILAVLAKVNKFFDEERKYEIAIADVDQSTLDHPIDTYRNLLVNGFTLVVPNGDYLLLGTSLSGRGVWADFTGQLAWRTKYRIKAGNSTVYVALIKYPSTSGTFYTIQCMSASNFTVERATNGIPYEPDATPTWETSNTSIRYYRNDSSQPFYSFEWVISTADDVTEFIKYAETSIPTSAIDTDGWFQDIAQLSLKTHGELKIIPGIQGSTTQVGKIQVDASKFTSVSNALEEIYSKIPQIADNRATLGTIQDDGSVTQETYVPVAPATGTLDNTQSTTGDNTQWDNDLPIWGIDPADNPTYIVDPDTETSVKEELTPEEPTRNPDTTGEGNTPTVIVPSGATQGLWAIYNPTQDQLKQFGAWLWADDFVEQIKKIFADPMQAIIGLHKVYSPVSTSGTQNIQVGYLDSGVSSKVVSEQYVTIDCGSVDLLEYFGNVFDYSPYTNVKLYLPFIGIVDLSTEDVLRSTISIEYGVDVLTGACLAMVSVKRDNTGGVLYQYSGNCAVTYPISSGSYMGVMSGILGVAGSIAGVLSGGALLPMVGAGIASAMSAKTVVQHSGSFSGNAGAMGGKIPYLIVTRPITNLPTRMEQIEGIPSNISGVVGDYTGYTKFKRIIVKNVPCSLTEVQLIEQLLTEGIYL